MHVRVIVGGAVTRGIVKFTTRQLSEFYFSLLEKKDALRLKGESQNKQRIDDINQAIHRLKNGQYGHCILCGQPILFHHLLAFPEVGACSKN